MFPFSRPTQRISMMIILVMWRSITVTMRARRYYTLRRRASLVIFTRTANRTWQFISMSIPLEQKPWRKKLLFNCRYATMESVYMYIIAPGWMFKNRQTEYGVMLERYFDTYKLMEHHRNKPEAFTRTVNVPESHSHQRHFSGRDVFIQTDVNNRGFNRWGEFW